MKIIAESSTTLTEWCLVDGTTIVERAETDGLNPFFQTRREISHNIRLNLPQTFFKRRWDHVYFYGAGCTNAEKKKIIESSLVAQFKTPTSVESDLLGAARGLLIREPGLACILRSGSNSCFYDGEKIVKNVRSLGFILGDEGSGAAIGRVFVGDCLKEIAPANITRQFFEELQLTPDMIMDSVYDSAFPTRALSAYSSFLAEHLDDEYVRNLVKNEIRRFFERNIKQYGKNDYPLCFTGHVACAYSEILCELADEYGVEIKKIIQRSMPGLILYHAND